MTSHYLNKGDDVAFIFFSKKMEIRPSVSYHQCNYWVEVSLATVLGFNHFQKVISERKHSAGTYKGLSFHLKGGKGPVILQQLNSGIHLEDRQKNEENNIPNLLSDMPYAGTFICGISVNPHNHHIKNNYLWCGCHYQLYRWRKFYRLKEIK